MEEAMVESPRATFPAMLNVTRTLSEAAPASESMEVVRLQLMVEDGLPPVVGVQVHPGIVPGVFASAAVPSRPEGSVMLRPRLSSAVVVLLLVTSTVTLSAGSPGWKAVVLLV
jgi:hypothetical protein